MLSVLATVIETIQKLKELKNLLSNPEHTKAFLIGFTLMCTVVIGVSQLRSCDKKPTRGTETKAAVADIESTTATIGVVESVMCDYPRESAEFTHTIESAVSTSQDSDSMTMSIE